MRTLVVGDPIVHLGPGTPYLADAALVVEDGRVREVGPRERLESGSFDRVLGSKDHFILPGFVNCHFHSEAALGRGLYELIFERANIWLHSNKAAPIRDDDLHDGILLRLVDCVRGGQTATVDMYYGRPDLADLGCEPALQAYADIGLRVAFGLVSRDQNIYVHAPNQVFLSCLPPGLASEVRASPIGYAWPVEEVFGSYRRLVRRWDGHDGRIRVILAPDWTPACSDELYRANRRLANEYATGLTTHVLETRSEMQFNFERYGRCAMARLAELGVLGEDATLAHFVWATDDDIDLLAASGAVASNNPGSNLRLSTGICRAREILDRGGRLAVGTDGISLGDREDFFDELRLAALLQRTPGPLAQGRIPSERLLRELAAAGARAVRFERQVGSLTPGKEADLLILRRDRVFGPPQRYARSDPLDVIVDRADSTDLETVLVRGAPILEGGKIVTIDEAATRRRFATAAAERLWRFATDLERRHALELPAQLEPYVLAFYERWVNTPLAPGTAYNASTGPISAASA
jgi:5-methylthioadenosine/S-adenosylhomocysteine deaminase